MRSFDAGGLEGLTIESDAGHGEAAEIRWQSAERLGFHVDNRDGMPEFVEITGEERADTSAPEDHYVHGRNRTRMRWA